MSSKYSLKSNTHSLPCLKKYITESMKTQSFIIGLLLMSAASAQHNDGKRPSWSKGLPERQGVPSVKLDESVPQTRTDLFQDIQSSSLESFETEHVEEIKPSFDSIQSSVPQLTLSVKDEQNDSEPAGQATPHVHNNKAISQAYDWRVQRMVPVELPPRLAEKHQNVVVKIAIDQMGRVQAVDSVIDGTSEVILRHAKKYIKQWRFEPPSKQGVTENIARVFNVALLHES